MKRGRYIDVDAPHIVEMRAMLGAVAAFVILAIAAALAAGCSGGSLRDALRFNAALDASVPQPIEPRETQAPPSPSGEEVPR